MTAMRLVSILCFYLVLESTIGQDVTNSQTEVVTESTGFTRTQPVEWDAISTVSVSNNRQGRFPQDESSRRPLLFSNDWRPLVMPVPPYGARLPQNRQPELGITTQAVLPSSGANLQNFSAPDYAYQTVSRNPVDASNLPYPFLYYPRMFPVDPTGLNSQPYSNLAEIQNYSSFNPLFYEPSGGEPDQIPPGSFPFPPYYFPSAPNLNNAENAIFSAPYPLPNLFYPTFPAVPNMGENANIPTINVYVRPPFVTPDVTSQTFKEDFTPLQSQASNVNQSEYQKESEPLETSIPDESFPSESLPLPSIPSGDIPLPFNAFAPGIIPPAPIINNVFLPRVIPGTFPQRFPEPPLIPPEELLPNPVSETAQPEQVSPPVLPEVESSEPGIQQNIPLPLDPKEPQLNKSPYEFGFQMNDGNGSGQSRQEISDGSGMVKGRYSYTDPFGMYRVVNYVADQNGFRAVVESNEPGVANPGSADVMVIAEPPPPHALAEGAKNPELISLVVPNESLDLVAQGTEEKELLSKR